VGTAELITEGDLYASAEKLAVRLNIPALPRVTISVKVEEIYDLGAAGRQVA